MAYIRCTNKRNLLYIWESKLCDYETRLVGKRSSQQKVPPISKHASYGMELNIGLSLHVFIKFVRYARCAESIRPRKPHGTVATVAPPGRLHHWYAYARATSELSLILPKHVFVAGAALIVEAIV